MSIFSRAGALAVLSLAGLGSSHAQPSKDLLECIGPFAKDADEAALIKAFGAANVVREDLDIGEMATEPGAVIFPQDPNRRIEVMWHDIAGRRMPKSIVVKDKSRWMVAARSPDQRRIAIGASLSTVEAINGKPFLINGFGRIYGGLSYSWEGGALEKAVACSLYVTFEPDPKVDDLTVRKASGGARFKSSSPVMRAAKPAVSEISLDWPP